MKQFFKLFLLILICLTPQLTDPSEIKILYKIENEIITNQDMINEVNYLISLNSNLKNLSKNNLSKIALNSVINEKIKLLEIQKSYDVSNESEELKKLINNNLYKRLNLSKEAELQNYFSSYDLNLTEIKSRIKIEFLWNKLIYDKYISRISIDKKKMKERIIQNSKKATIEEFYLKEILFEVETNETIENKYYKILESVKKDGFSNAANIFSISDNSKYGGVIGWIKKTQLSKKILDEVIDLKEGESTKPIMTGAGYLILNLEKKRIIQTKINVDLELKNLIEKETDRQLNQYSTILFNKLKKNTFINEL